MKIAAVTLTLALAWLAPTGVFAQETPAWHLEIEPGDWTFVSEAEGMVVFARRIEGDDHRISVRWEYPDGHFARTVPGLVEQFPAYARVRSVMSLVEIDCEGRRRHPLEETLYGRPNLEGEQLLRRVEERPWTVVREGTNGWHQVEWFCDGEADEGAK